MEIPSMVTGSSNMEPFCPILSCHPTGTQVIQVILMIGMILAAIGLVAAFSWATYRTYNPTRTYGNSMQKSRSHGY